MTQATQFGDLVRQRRMELKISVRDLARRIGVSHVFLGEVERGLRPTVGEGYWSALAAALNLTVEQLREAARRSVPVRLDLRGVAPEDAAVLQAFARSVEAGTLDAKKLAEIRKIIGGGS